MTEVWFYHLEGRPVEAVLPVLIEKSIERGWRAVVQTRSPERVEALDLALWTYDEASFLAHGTKRDGNAAMQPVYLTDDDANPSGATIRFFLEGAEVGPALASPGADYARAVLIFDGRDEEELEGARRQWSGLRDAGHAVSYWQQSEDGRWTKRA